MNLQIILFGEEQEQVCQLIESLLNDQFQYLIQEIPKYKSKISRDLKILRQKKTYSYNEAVDIIYLPEVNYQDNEFLSMIKQFKQNGQNFKILICFRGCQNIEQRAETIRNYFKQESIDVQNQIGFLGKTSCQEKHIYQKQIFCYNSSSLQNQQSIINFITSQRRNKTNEIRWDNQITQEFQQQFYEINKNITTPDFEREILFILNKQNIFCQFGINFSNQKQSLVYIILIKAILQNCKQSLSNTLKSTFICSNCKMVYNFTQQLKVTVFNSKNFQIDIIDNCDSHHCKFCKSKFQQLKKQDLEILLEEKIIKDYLETLDTFFYKKETSKALSVLVLNNEGLISTSIFSRLYPEIQESRSNFTEGQDINERFYLIQPPEFNFDLNQEETLEIYQQYLKRKKINYILCCINFQRDDLMKKRIGEMQQYLNGINNSQLGICVFTQNELSKTDYQCLQNKFLSFKQYFSSPLIVVNPDESNEQLIKKIEQILSDCEQMPQLNFQHTFFELDDYQNENIFSGIVKSIEDKEIKNLENDELQQNKELEYIRYEQDRAKKLKYELQQQIYQVDQTLNDLKQREYNQRLKCNQVEKQRKDLQFAQQSKINDNYCQPKSCISTYGYTENSKKY